MRDGLLGVVGVISETSGVSNRTTCVADYFGRRPRVIYLCHQCVPTLFPDGHLRPSSLLVGSALCLCDGPLGVEDLRSYT